MKKLVKTLSTNFPNYKFSICRNACFCDLIVKIKPVNNFIKEKIESKDRVIEEAVVGPSEAILNIKNLPLKELVENWNISGLFDTDLQILLILKFLILCMLKKILK